MSTLTPREIDDLRFAVRADRQAFSMSARLEAAVEEIVDARLAATTVDVIAALHATAATDAAETLAAQLEGGAA